MNRENEIIAEDKREFSAIDVDDGISFLAQRIRSLTPPQPLTLCSIYRVPDNLRKGNEDKYEPSVVSIGPYHRAKQNLNITEKHKLWYLRDFISRSTPPQTSLEDIVQAVKNLEEDARACYAEEIYLSSDDFVMMMEIGVKFKAKYGGWLLDVTFEEGYIALPPLVVGQLLKSKDDVKFLREPKIFFGNENEDEKFVTEIKMLCQRAKPTEFHYNDLRFNVRDIPKLGGTDKEQTCTTGM
ncbi:putative transmembrane protein [Thalictrum thalictroides]|uniref:Putative transmembrane protein n=1 Tax=Thalictrum thalictroides TaxID=46969 RepID=A0A7J6VRW8_THATH|nr:putative transmembrane protein [Thalictrum thalictroides]